MGEHVEGLPRSLHRNWVSVGELRRYAEDQALAYTETAKAYALDGEMLIAKHAAKIAELLTKLRDAAENAQANIAELDWK